MEENMHVLAIGAHVDDIEIGCAGMLHSMLKKGNISQLSVVYFSPPDNVVGDKRFGEEYKRAMESWGFEWGNKNFGMYFKHTPVRQFTGHRNDIRQYLWDTFLGYPPNLVLVPSTREFHQDHVVVTEEASRVFRKCTLLGYEMPMISLAVEGVMYYPLEQADLDAKEMAIAHYTSQKHRASMRVGIMTGLAMIRGNQIGRDYAEAYEVIRWIHQR
jgi:LmbE family N-acetylglucosaminyl deacetylase